MNRRVEVAAVFALAMFLSGCSFFGKKTQELTVNVNPEDARVLINGKWYDPPVKITIPTTRDVSVTATRAGYSSDTAARHKVLSKLGTLDLVGTVLILVPGIGLFSDGAYEIPDTHFYFDLEKEKNVSK